MMMALAVSIRLLVAQPVPVDDCALDAPRLLAMPYSAFDQDPTGGWRPLEQRGCTEAVANLLQLYRQQHRPLSDRERNTLAWHEGQLRAIQGDYNHAVPLLLNGIPEDGDAIDFVDYALATVAFLRRDKPGLIAARNRLAAFPRPAGFASTVTVTGNGKTSTVSLDWPLNLDVLDGLIRCFDKPYKIAYSCRN